MISRFTDNCDLWCCGFDACGGLFGPTSTLFSDSSGCRGHRTAVTVVVVEGVQVVVVTVEPAWVE